MPLRQSFSSSGSEKVTCAEKSHNFCNFLKEVWYLCLNNLYIPMICHLEQSGSVSRDCLSVLVIYQMNHCQLSELNFNSVFLFAHHLVYLSGSIFARITHMLTHALSVDCVTKYLCSYESCPYASSSASPLAVDIWPTGGHKHHSLPVISMFFALCLDLVSVNLL